MKFLHADESGEISHTDVFVMGGLMVGARSFIKTSNEFDRILASGANGNKNEFKASEFMMRCKDGKNTDECNKRQKFLEKICRRAVSKGRSIYCLALSFSAVASLLQSSGDKRHPNDAAWHESGMFICSLVQQKMQRLQKGAGRTFAIFDSSRRVWPLSEALQDSYKSNNPYLAAQYDGLHQIFNPHQVSPPLSQQDRFNQIMNKTVFPVRSEQSALLQVADAICYVYRRHLELTDSNEIENWNGERNYYRSLFGILERGRMKLGVRAHKTERVRFFEAARHPHMTL